MRHSHPVPDSGQLLCLFPLMRGCSLSKQMSELFLFVKPQPSHHLSGKAFLDHLVGSSPLQFLSMHHLFVAFIAFTALTTI